MGCQLTYLVAELKMFFSGINSLLRSSNDLWTCTVRVLKDFENPADSGSSVQNYRYSLAQQYYNMFAVRTDKNNNKDSFGGGSSGGGGASGGW